MRDRVELIPSLAALQALRSDWDDLYGRCRAVSPFQSPAWLLPWGRHFAPDRLRAIAIREPGRLIALVPFHVWQGRLLLAGTGPTDYCDGLFADAGMQSDGSGELADEALAALATCADDLGCERVDLQQLLPGSPLLRARVPQGWRTSLGAGDVCPVATLARGDALRGISPSWRKNIARAKRKLREVCHARIQLSSSSLVEGAAEALASLHAARWQTRGQAGVLSDDLMNGFLRSALPELSAAGLLRLHVLELEDRVLAALLGLRGHRCTCFYISGFDPEWSRYSPGSVLITEALCQAEAEGLQEFHFLRGREPYKYRFGAQDRLTWRRVLTRHG